MAVGGVISIVGEAAREVGVGAVGEGPLQALADKVRKTKVTNKIILLFIAGILSEILIRFG
jgi:hypothetical protein